MLDEDILTLKSGRTIYANRGLISINQDLEISEGYDSGINWPSFDEDDTNNYTKEDMQELADIMIKRWQDFKDAL